MKGGTERKKIEKRGKGPSLYEGRRRLALEVKNING